ncbi:unnamed protein product [Rhizophagus irregularis]|nr:unnamed protein product [Rhizophagus irregularis]CAB5216314.1 unnamed protein product [Rhizophagus irregularis]
MVIGDFGICENVKFTNRHGIIRSSLYGSSYQHRELDFVVNELLLNLPGRIGLGSVLGTKLLPDFDSARRGEDSIYYCSLFLEEVKSRLYKTSHFKSKYEKFMIKNDYISKGKLNFEESIIFNGHIDTNATPVYDKVETTFIGRNLS